MRNHSETAQIIQLAAFRSKPDKSEVPRELPTSNPQREESLTETGKNFRLRQHRRNEWHKANAAREYWRTMMKMDHAISGVQRHELPEGDAHPEHDPGRCRDLVAKYRAATMAQLLTPAPTMLEVIWKRSTFKHGDHKYSDIKPERIERAIADDVEFLKAHPVRRPPPKDRLEKRREWKAELRARVTLYAQQNGIPKSELAWLGWLKHQHLAAFADRHRLSYDWLLEGSGPEHRAVGGGT